MRRVQCSPGRQRAAALAPPSHRAIGGPRRCRGCRRTSRTRRPPGQCRDAVQPRNDHPRPRPPRSVEPDPARPPSRVTSPRSRNPTLVIDLCGDTAEALPCIWTLAFDGVTGEQALLSSILGGSSPDRDGAGAKPCGRDRSARHGVPRHRARDVRRCPGALHHAAAGGPRRRGSELAGRRGGSRNSGHRSIDSRCSGWPAKPSRCWPPRSRVASIICAIGRRTGGSAGADFRIGASLDCGIIPGQGGTTSPTTAFGSTQTPSRSRFAAA